MARPLRPPGLSDPVLDDEPARHPRASAQRARARDSTPKHTRFRFRLAREIDGEPLQRLTFTGREGRQIELVPGETYSARDELELAELASQLARGVVEVERCASA